MILTAARNYRCGVQEVHDASVRIWGSLCRKLGSIVPAFHQGYHWPNVRSSTQSMAVLNLSTAGRRLMATLLLSEARSYGCRSSEARLGFHTCMPTSDISIRERGQAYTVIWCCLCRNSRPERDSQCTRLTSSSTRSCCQPERARTLVGRQSMLDYCLWVSMSG